jgi:hypothetical protein
LYSEPKSSISGLALSYAWRIKLTSEAERALKRKEPFVILKFDRRDNL